MSCGKISFKNSCERTFTITFSVLFLLLLLLFLGPNLEAEEEIDTGWDQVPILTDNDLNDVLALNETAAFANLAKYDDPPISSRFFSISK